MEYKISFFKSLEIGKTYKVTYDRHLFCKTFIYLGITRECNYIMFFSPRLEKVCKFKKYQINKVELCD